MRWFERLAFDAAERHGFARTDPRVWWTVFRALVRFARR
jgi:hypothetical protein